MNLFRQMSENGVGPFPGMTSTCVIKRPTDVRDPATGRITRTFSDVLMTKCRVQPLRGREGVVAEQLSEVVEATCHLRLGTDIRVTDRVVVDGRTYEVHSVPPRSEALKPHEEALIGRVS
jgi:SPP1 family predicted phage head-tail adaptor